MAQWDRITVLERQLQRLREEMLAMAPSRDAPEPPPPHY